MKRFRALRVPVGLMLLMGMSQPVLCEQLLSKDGGEYLGWKVNEVDFKTCTGSLIKIGTGTLKNTSEVCKNDDIIKPISSGQHDIPPVDPPPLND